MKSENEKETKVFLELLLFHEIKLAIFGLPTSSLLYEHAKQTGVTRSSVKRSGSGIWLNMSLAMSRVPNLAAKWSADQPENMKGLF